MLNKDKLRFPICTSINIHDHKLFVSIGSGIRSVFHCKYQYSISECGDSAFGMLMEVKDNIFQNALTIYEKQFGVMLDGARNSLISLREAIESMYIGFIGVYKNPRRVLYHVCIAEVSEIESENFTLHEFYEFAESISAFWFLEQLCNRVVNHVPANVAVVRPFLGYVKDIKV